MIRVLLLITMLFLPKFLSAHELRPAYLSIAETAPGAFSIVWKVPAAGTRRLGLYAYLPASCTPEGDAQTTLEGAVYIERWDVTCDPGLKGQSIAIEGLQSTMTDVLVRIAYFDGSVEFARLTPDLSQFVVEGAQGFREVVGTFFILGVDHILSGYDHLLFVLALILLIHDRWMLLKTITAFTVAHSITLALATLGLFSLPQKPVEATIALSIVFIAVELVKAQPGRSRMSERFPWLVAFAFGLLHGFGFAGALMETGLPQSDVPVALLSFNLGVEVGQLLFVALVLAFFRAFHGLFSRPVVMPRRIAGYGIGTVSMFWLILRLVGLGGA